MLFSSPVFVLAFLPGCLGGFFWLGRRGGAWPLAWLLGASLFFYGWWNPVFVTLLLASIGGNYALGTFLYRRGATAGYLLAAGIAANLALLGWFKYAGFIVGIITGAVPAGWGAAPPLAISFFTFQQIMFLAESQRRERPRTGLLAYACFVALFPHLIAGPLVRPREILPQLTAAGLARYRADDLALGLERFLLGLAKKLVLADSFATFADPGFDAAAQGATLSLIEAWVALLAYALQIYFDFSGYSDMAIGLARMLNLRFPENFASPYRARDIADFWRRWHITLGQFLRDYVYIPLGGSRRGLARTGANLTLTMLLAGLWHGAAWNFVIWGALHGAFLAVHATWRRLGLAMPGAAGWALTLLCVTLAWIPFRAADLAAAGRMLRALAGGNGLALPALVLDAWPGLAGIAHKVPVLAHLGDARGLSLPVALVCLAVGWMIVLLGPGLAAMGRRARLSAIGASFALTVQALFLAPHAVPFVYFRF